MEFAFEGLNTLWKEKKTNVYAHLSFYHMMEREENKCLCSFIFLPHDVNYNAEKEAI